ALILPMVWCAAACAFGLWQFSRSLNFDVQAAGAGRQRRSGKASLVDGFYRFPLALFRDPLGALIEKELRSLLRSPRFRFVFLIGFTFGVIILLPTTLTRNGRALPFFRSNYLTVVSMYSLLLLGEVCFWNAFGFDRSAAQLYFLAPVRFSRVLIGKNLSALFFVGLEISLVSAVCAVMGMPLNGERVMEAFCVAGVICIFLLGAGNLMSVHQARGVNPATSFRTGGAGRVQAILFVVYPIAFLPAGLAYLARWAFDSQAAFFAVLG